MTQIKVDSITDVAGTGAPDFSDGLTVSGGAISALNTAEYYSSGTEPTSPKNGAIWWDSTNSKVMVYIAAEFKEVELGASAGGGWTVDLSNVTYDSVSFSVTGQDVSPVGIRLNSDGTKMFMIGLASDNVFQYTLSTAFDLSTASYNSVSFSVASQNTTPGGMYFNADGTKMYVIGNDDVVYQYSLSTAFDLSTASYDSVSFDASNQGTGMQGAVFNLDGTKMYMADLANDSLFQYSLSTGFDVSTASYNNVSFSVASQETLPRDMALNSDGTKLYMVGNASDNVFQYSLSTAYDLSTASYDSVSFSVATQAQEIQAFTFNADGTKMYIVDAGNDTIYQYSTGL